jgi:20S proteasome alpha/beta subunit
LFLPYAFSNLLNSLYQYKLENLFPNGQIFVSLRILLTIPATLASAERSFSKLKLEKSYLRSTMSQDHLVDLARLSIESEIARKINFDNVITRFALKKTRKAPLNAIVK